MDDTLLFIPPCCVNKKLPKAVMQAPRRTLTFYTQGDVTMEKFFRAIAYLLDTSKPHKKHFCVMVLAQPMMTAETSVFLQQCFEREWITHLVLSTGTKKDDLLDMHLWEFRDKILYTHNKDVSDISSHMVLYTDEKALELKGPMMERMSGQLSAYSLVYYPDYANFVNSIDWGNPLKNVCFPDMLRHRQQVSKSKQEVKGMLLNAFLKGDFPPYKNMDDEPLSHGDHHNFGQV